MGRWSAAWYGFAQKHETLNKQSWRPCTRGASRNRLIGQASTSVTLNNMAVTEDDWRIEYNKWLRGAGTVGMAVKGIVMIGPENADNERAIEKYGDVPVLGRIPMLSCICYKNLVDVFNSEFDKAAFA